MMPLSLLMVEQSSQAQVKDGEFVVFVKSIAPVVIKVFGDNEVLLGSSEELQVNGKYQTLNVNIQGTAY